MNFYTETDQKDFELFYREISAIRPNIKMVRTPELTRHDVIIDDETVVEIKTRLNLSSRAVKTSHGDDSDMDLCGCVMLNNNKLNYLKNLKGFKKVFVAYILKDVYYIIDVNTIKIRNIKPRNVWNPGTQRHQIEICAYVDITGEKEYKRLTHE